MKQTHIPLTRDLVLIGGGHTHALVLHAWGMNPLAGVRLTVINPGPTAPYSGMLPGFVAGHYTRDDLDIDLVKLCRFAGARLIIGAADGVDKTARHVSVAGRPDVAYDVLSIDIGVTSAMPALEGFTDHGTPAKPLGPFASKWDAFRSTTQHPKVAVIGGGVAGSELALAMQHALGAQSVVSLIDRGTVLKDLGTTARSRMRAALTAQGVTIVENTDVIRVDDTGVHLSNGQHIRAGFVTGAAGARPHAWQSDIGLDMHDGFIKVAPTLQSSDPAIFAVGDCAHMTQTPRPKAGVFAVRQAPVLTRNLRSVLTGKALQDFRPQADYLKLISLGEKSALAEKFGTVMSGPLLWRLKNRIDRKFMGKFAHLPVMAAPDLPADVALDVRATLGDRPMCGGCGAKVGATALQNALRDVPNHGRDDVITGAGDDAAVLRTGNAVQVMTTDHLRSFTADPVTMARIAAVHALGDIWAMGAAPQAVTAHVILPKMSGLLQQRVLSEIMQAAGDVIVDAGAAVVGGHSSLGEEMTIGFTVTGLCDDGPKTLAGARIGDALILTKPIGSGVIMAADMAGQVQGDVVAQALSLMMQGQGAAAQILRDAHAMTDVTGFGLMGHLSGMCAASGVDAQLDLAAVPVMDGAQALSDAGIRSSLYADNLAAATRVTGAKGKDAALLFDPQTAGGLLAAVDGATAGRIVSDLRAAGYDAALIGQIVSGDGAVKVQTKSA